MSLEQFPVRKSPEDEILESDLRRMVDDLFPMDDESSRHQRDTFLARIDDEYPAELLMTKRELEELLSRKEDRNTERNVS